MKYFINLFSPETATIFTNSDKSVTGFRISCQTYVYNQNIQKGDRFVCYCTKIQRIIGLLEVLGEAYIDNTPLFVPNDDPFVLRFKVKTIVWLSFEKAIPLHESILWDNLSFTKKLTPDSTAWTYMVFASPRLWPKKDCEYIEKVLIEQNRKQKSYPLTESDQKKLKTSNKIRISSAKEIAVTVPNEEDEKAVPKCEDSLKEIRDSFKVQAQLAAIGERLGFKIWLPKSDRSRVLEMWKPNTDKILLEELPLVLDNTTLKTIRNIDVLWIEKRSIRRAFEVEGTTSIYSGILRMADLLSLQPMLDIKIHIVAPTARRDLVFEQINRPVFAVLEKAPLAELCTYISYDSIYELAKAKNLEHTKHTILDEYEEFATDVI